MTKPGWLVTTSNAWSGTCEMSPPEARTSKELLPVTNPLLARKFLLRTALFESLKEAEAIA